jgi:hypothetical protein
MIRTALLALVGVVAWFLAHSCDGRPTPRGAEAPATQFSAARADAILGRILGPELPHPISSVEADAVRERVLQELSALGVTSTVREGAGCFFSRAFGMISCAHVKNIIAEVVPGQGPAIVLLSHYDSVGAGPGAADDASGVAVILETVRALKARNSKSTHPIIAAITDGEEAGLLGADALLKDPEFRARVGVVVNMEARGNTGASLLFQTSPGDSKLIDLYKDSVDSYSASSLFAVIYELLPNDTDLSPFIEAGFPAFNFAFSGNLAHYHTPLDRRENIERSTLQHHGDNLLGVVSSLQTTKLESLRGGTDDAYVPILGRWLPRVPVSWTLPLAVVALVLLLVTVFLSREGSGGAWAWTRAALTLPAMLIGSVVIGFGIHIVASMISGQPDPAFAHPSAMRLGLGAGVFAIFVACTRLGDTKRLALAVWLWMAGLAVVTALLVPGLSPYFLFPSLIASVLLLAQSRSSSAWTGRVGQLALAGSAVMPVVLWISLAVVGESVQGLFLHPLFTAPAAFGLLALLPLAAAPVGPLLGGLSKRGWRTAAAALAAVALLLGVVQGMRPAFSDTQPQRLSISFVDDHTINEASWITSTLAPLPASLRAAAPFSDKRITRGALRRGPAFTAPAGKTRFAAPTVQVTEQPSAGGRTVTLAIEASPEAAQVVVGVPPVAGLRAATVNGARQAIGGGGVLPWMTVGCVSRDCQHATITLEVGAAPFEVTVSEVRFGLPPDGQKLTDARPKTAVPSQDGDTTIVLTSVPVKGS